ncbi:hypothetical protein ACLOJK_000442 [Asimina triloba]
MPSIMKVIPFFPSKSKKKKKQNELAKDQSDPLSFGSTTSFSSISSSGGGGTPKTVLLPPSSPPSSADPSSFVNRIGAADLHILEVFKIFDRDNDGKITLSELELLFHRLALGQPTQDELVTMLNEADLDGDGCISLEEFGALSSALGPAHGPELRDAFDYYDTDGDERISAEELREVFLALGDEGCTLEDCRRMISGVDVEGKGFVEFDDFVRMMEGRR